MLAAYLPEERGAQNSMIYLAGVAEWLMVAFQAPTEEAPLLDAEFFADGYVV